MNRHPAQPERIMLFRSAATSEMAADSGIAYPANKYGKILYAAA